MLVYIRIEILLISWTWLSNNLMEDYHFLCENWLHWFKEFIERCVAWNRCGGFRFYILSFLNDIQLSYYSWISSRFYGFYRIPVFLNMDLLSCWNFELIILYYHQENMIIFCLSSYFIECTFWHLIYFALRSRIQVYGLMFSVLSMTNRIE